MSSPAVAQRLAPFGTSIFAEMTRLAQAHQAINLAQGFPDFDGPDFIKRAAIRAIEAGHAQYARSFGVPALNTAIARFYERDAGLMFDPDTEITVTCGCTEAIAAAMLGLLNPGDEVVLFEPFYDSYPACIAMAGALPRFVRLHPRDGAFAFDEANLRAAFTARTRAVLVNTPHNPTGKVFSERELTLIADLALRHDAFVISDEVYEHLVYELEQPHLRLAALPGMRDRTLTLSSLGKTFSLTGWKVGWALGAPALTRAVRAAHQFLTFAGATPLQHAAAEALEHAEDAIPDLVAQFRERRDFLGDVLTSLRFNVFTPAGTYFILADFSRLSAESDVAFCQRLTREVGVAAIPPSAFYHNASGGHSLVRFAFCKQRATLEAAARRLQALRGA
ncbi:MAG: aminotransferase class I/II-fold pyridoxal phosphate-dependent enzyme [Phycisphaerales bacterium]|nr:aminotransferase class I/II-fold pyridoxal phosphate-dependent enzyme [Phycisphaerales bacterium]